MKVLYRSGYANIADDDAPLDAPLLPKPFTTKELLQAVREILDAPATASRNSPG